MSDQENERNGNSGPRPASEGNEEIAKYNFESHENIKTSLSGVLGVEDYPTLCRMCGQQFAGPIPCRRMLAKMQAGRLHGGCYLYTPAYIEPMPAMSGIIDAEALQARARLLRESCTAVLAKEARP